MAVFFCAETGGFYPGKPYGDAVGKACVKLSQETYETLMEGINQGKEIKVVDGWPGAVDRLVSSEQSVAFERNWRDLEVRKTDWLVARHRDERDLVLAPTLTVEQFPQLLAYRQALRDWPQAADFPSLESRPIAPSWLAIQTQ
ncbi:phage tail assembly chaperone [Pseudomonas sp. R1-6]|uniref:phage tail assembly chaperone n=1 Tax=Pseudomonas sp. R1-6 TaxID=2817397 RepID=UPI003DA9099F